MRVLVVGGAGYVGAHAVKRLLSGGHRVTVLDNLSRGHRQAVLCDDFVEADLLDSSSLRNALRTSFDAVMHFAALCYVGESVRKPQAYYRNNVTGTLNLLDAMLEAGVNKLVFSSTCSTYGDPVEIPMAETHRQSPINPYGSSKLMVETVLKDYASAYGLMSVALRYFNAAGSDPEGRIGECHDPETHLIPLVLREALRVRQGGDPADTQLVVHGSDYATPDGTCIRDYVHVDDLAAAHIAAMLGMHSGVLAGSSAYNLGIGKGFSVLEVIESARRVTRVPIRYRVGPRRPGDPPQLVADSAAARHDLKWMPEYLELDDIVATAGRWLEDPSRCTSLA